jgi:hypothetical protein
MTSKRWTECDGCGRSVVATASSTEGDTWFGLFESGGEMDKDLDFCSWDCLRTFVVEHPRQPGKSESASAVTTQPPVFTQEMLDRARRYIHPCT